MFKLLSVIDKNVLSGIGSANLLRYLSTNTKNNGLVVVDDKTHNGITRIIMSNEKQRNSLGIEMINELNNSVRSVDLDKCRVLVISSSNSKVYSSGHNLKEFTSDRGVEHHREVFDQFTKLCMSLKNLPVPTIAEVDGLAAAAGFQLASSCDLIVASDRASFSTPGVKFGVFCSTPGVPLSRNVSSKISLKMLFTGEPITALEACNHGIISEIVTINNDPEILRERVNEIAKKIMSNSKPIIALGKECFYKQIEMKNLEDAYKIAGEAMVNNLKYEDTQSGLEAFAAKRKPQWSHSNKKSE